METFSAPSYMPKSDWFDQESNRTYWTKEEDKRFESALVLYGENVPDRWIKVAAMIPGKTVLDVIKKYKELEEDVFDIEAGRVPIPCYHTGARGPEQERKKGVPWTEEEHRRFLMGLKKYGKGDWRNISRNFVVSRTPTQVARHAQKYYLRQLSGGKDKTRPSIHMTLQLSISQTLLSQTIISLQ